MRFMGRGLSWLLKYILIKPSPYLVGGGGCGVEYRLGDRMVCGFPSCRQFADDDVEHGCKEKTEERHTQHPEEYGCAECPARFRSCALSEHQRDNAENERKTRHQNRTQAKARS